MPINYTCRCGKQYLFSNDQALTREMCPACHNSFIVPRPRTQSPIEETPGPEEQSVAAAPVPLDVPIEERLADGAAAEGMDEEDPSFAAPDEYCMSARAALIYVPVASAVWAAVALFLALFGLGFFHSSLSTAANTGEAVAGHYGGRIIIWAFLATVVAFYFSLAVTPREIRTRAKTWFFSLGVLSLFVGIIAAFVFDPTPLFGKSAVPEDELREILPLALVALLAVFGAALGACIGTIIGWSVTPKREAQEGRESEGTFLVEVDESERLDTGLIVLPGITTAMPTKGRAIAVAVSVVVLAACFVVGKNWYQKWNRADQFQRCLVDRLTSEAGVFFEEGCEFTEPSRLVDNLRSLRLTRSRDSLLEIVKAHCDTSVYVDLLVVGLGLPDAEKASKGNETRKCAIVRLGELGPEAKDAVPHLVGLISCGDWRVRVELAEALVQIGTVSDHVVPGLLDLLWDDSAYVRFAAVKAVGQLGEDASVAVPRLSALLEDPDGEISATSAQVLGGLQGQSRRYQRL